MVVMASMDVREILDDTAPPQNMDDLRKKIHAELTCL